MLILPADSRFTRGRWPVMTIGLILANAFVFFGLQSRDDQAWARAADYYFSTDLKATEFPRYRAWLAQHDEGGRSAALAAAQGEDASAWVLHTMQSDRRFMRELHAGSIVPPTDQAYADWHRQRERADRLFDAVVTERYVFRSDEPSVVTAFTSMFLHGGTEHLVGNMVVLFLVGGLAEVALGPGLYLLFYLLSGLCAGAAYWLVHYAQSEAVLGASGAISGVMAMVAALYGRRRLRFFYSVLFYFDFITLPAIAVLPYWIGWEILQHFVSDARVAYEAHAGGLVGGALLAFAARARLKAAIVASMDRPAQEENWDKSFQEAMALMAKLQLQRASQIFRRLRAERPKDLRPLVQLYRIARSQPASDDYHGYAQDLLSVASTGTDVLDDYWKIARPAPRLAAPVLKALLLRHAAAADCERVDKILAVIQKRGDRDPQLGQALTSLAARLAPDKAAAYRLAAARHLSG